MPASLISAAKADDLLLYHAWMSSASRRVRFCLEEKALGYREIALDLTGNEQHRPEYLAINPNGFVPALIHGDRVLIEATAINEYLDDVFPERPLRPADAYGRARMRVWTKYIDEMTIRAFQVASWNGIIGPVAARWSDAEMEQHLARIPTPDRREDWRRMARRPFTADEVALALDTIRDGLARMEAILAVAPWLAGDDFSLADISMAPYVVRIGEFAEQGITLDALPAVADWWRRIVGRPGFAAARIAPIGAPAVAAREAVAA